MRFLIHLFEQIDPLLKVLIAVFALVGLAIVFQAKGLIVAAIVFLFWLAYKLVKWVYTEWLYYSGRRERYNHWDW